jgi:hypothetical protein
MILNETVQKWQLPLIILEKLTFDQLDVLEDILNAAIVKC